MTLVMQATKGRLYGGAVNGPLASIARIGGQCRTIWNHFLEQSVERYKAEREFVFYTEMSAALPKLLKTDTRLIGCPHRAAQMTVQKLDRALRECGKKLAARKGFPKFKRRSNRNDAFSFVGGECRFATGRVRLPKIGWVRIRGITLPDGADPRQINVTQEPDGWHLSVQFVAPAKVYRAPNDGIVGIDLGISKLLTLDNGEYVENRRGSIRFENRIRRLNRERDRRRKGSVNRRRTVVRLGRLHRDLRNRRHNFLHKLTRRLVDTYTGFAVEDLSLKGLSRTRLAKFFADAGLAEFLRMLRYKAEWAGREWREVPRFTRSTGVCPECHTTGPRLALSVREWACQTCGAVHDRDVAAARIIASRAVGIVRSPEPAGVIRRKRGAAVRGGAAVQTVASRRGPPSNVALTGDIP